MKSCGVADFLLMGRQEQSKLNRFNWETGTQSWKTGLFSEKYPLLVIFLRGQMTLTEENLEMPLRFMETWAFEVSTWNVVLVIHCCITSHSKT